MAHKVETMAYANEVPWHGIGVQVEETLTPMEMMKAADLDWKVEIEQCKLADGKTDADGICALVRTKNGEKNVLGPSGPKYIPTQNRDVFGFFEKFVKQNKMTMETAGSLDDGRHVWGLAKMNKGFSLPGKDRTEGYLLLSHPHIYGKSLTIMFTPIRVVCNNTLTMALNRQLDERFRMSHINAFDVAQQQEAENILGLSVECLKHYKEQAKLLSEKQLKGNQLEQYVVEVFQPQLLRNEEGLIDRKKKLDPETYSRTVDQVLAAYDKAPGQEMSRGSWWSAYNAVTYQIDHNYGNSDNARLREVWFGKQAGKKRKALELAVQLAA